jgi:hypothetical protein
VNTSQFGRLGGQLGVLLCLVGFGVIFFGWNGAASKNVVMAQFPYLISGGIAGLAIVVIGAAMLVVQSAREDRARLEATMQRLLTAVESGGAGGLGGGGANGGVAGGVGAVGPRAVPSRGGLVLSGTTSYHRLDCSLTEAREEAHVIGLEEAITRGMDPCRVCRPPALAPTGG